MTSPLSALLTPSIVRRIGVRRARLLRNQLAIVVGAVVTGVVAFGFAVTGD